MKLQQNLLILLECTSQQQCYKEFLMIASFFGGNSEILQRNDRSGPVTIYKYHCIFDLPLILQVYLAS